MILVSELWRNSLIFPFSFTHFQGKVPENTIKHICGSQMGRVDQIVRTLGMFLDPGTLIGRVIEYEVGQRQNSPFFFHHLRELLEVLHRVSLTLLNAGIGIYQKFTKFKNIFKWQNDSSNEFYLVISSSGWVREDLLKWTNYMQKNKEIQSRMNNIRDDL